MGDGDRKWQMDGLARWQASGVEAEHSLRAGGQAGSGLVANTFLGDARIMARGLRVWRDIAGE
jgi:hypothetical protein